MTLTRLVVAAVVVSSLLGCKKDGEAPSTPAPGAVPPPAAAPPPAPKGPELVEVDLSPWGDAFKGYVAMAPKGTKVQFDDPSRQLLVTESDYLNMNEAPFFEDGLASVGKDPEQKNVVKTATEASWERDPPLGHAWAFDALVKTGDAKWSCNGETFSNAEMARTLQAICKSVKKK